MNEVTGEEAPSTRRCWSARSAATTRRSPAARACSTTTSCGASRQLRNWRGDRLRTARFQRIVDPKAMPLIAIRLQVMARKSLGGIQTDLGCRVLREHRGRARRIPGLYAVGEAAGFGGGGVHGKRSLEGTFLGGCVFTGRLAAAAIAGAELPLRIPPRVPAAVRTTYKCQPPDRPYCWEHGADSVPTAPEHPSFDYMTVGHVTVDVLDDDGTRPAGRGRLLQRAAGGAPRPAHADRHPGRPRGDRGAAGALPQ